MEDLKQCIREVPDFPKAGILFYDITTLLKDRVALRKTIDRLSWLFADRQVDKVVGIESRGFLFGAQVAYKLNAGFVPVRKPGKLPADTVHQTYELEYGSDRIEMHRDSIAPGENVLIVDDLIATGGTAGAAVRLARDAGAEVVGCAFLIELTALDGRRNLGVDRVHVVMQY